MPGSDLDAIGSILAETIVQVADPPPALLPGWFQGERNDADSFACWTFHEAASGGLVGGSRGGLQQ
jgi:hypothetical protein